MPANVWLTCHCGAGTTPLADRVPGLLAALALRCEAAVSVQPVLGGKVLFQSVLTTSVLN